MNLSDGKSTLLEVDWGNSDGAACIKYNLPSWVQVAPL